MARKVILTLLRHGERAEGGQADELSEAGFEQARAAGRQLAANSKGMITKVYWSPTVRAKQTGAEIAKEFWLAGLGTRVSRERKNFIGKYDKGRFRAAVKEAGGEDAAVEKWLDGNFDPQALESIGAAQKRLGTMLSFPYKLARLFSEQAPSNRPDVNLVYVSHSFSLSAIVRQLLNKRISELGGAIKPCEAITFAFDGEKCNVSFRGKKFEANVKPLILETGKKFREKRFVRLPLRKGIALKPFERIERFRVKR